MILVINSGSSSIKFALYKSGIQPEKVLHGQLSRIGREAVDFAWQQGEQQGKQNPELEKNDFPGAVSWLIAWLENQIDMSSVGAIGHRVVHGMQQTEPAVITTELLEQLRKSIPYDPEHLPGEIHLIEAFHQQHPSIRQYGCFDTAFHQNMPRVAKLLSIPRRFDQKGIHRYGFHGISYQYLMKALEKTAGEKAAKGRVILAHLGNGASMAAVYQGKSIDTSMGFTPAGGLPMSSRSGDLDPGVAWFMIKSEQLSPDQFSHIINHESGLLGISETSGDMSDLLAREHSDPRCAEAVAFFCYQVKKWIGSFAAALGGIDTLIFAGGIGENAPAIRERICDGMGFLGIELDRDRNERNNALLSASSGSVAVRMIHTDEEWMIAKIVAGLEVSMGK